LAFQETVLETFGDKPPFDVFPVPTESQVWSQTCVHKPRLAPELDCAMCGVKGLSVCSTLEPDEYESMEKIGRVFCSPAKSTLFAQGRDAKFVWNLTAGALRLSKLLPDGRRQVIGFALPGDFLGLAMASTHMFTADALTPVKVCQFSRVGFSQLIDKRPPLMRRLMEMVAHELSLAQDQMVILGRRTAEEKIAAFLIGMRDRYARLSGQCVDVPLPMSRHDIGDFLGLSVETVSRMMTRLAREQTIVMVRNGVRLLNVRRLEHIAEV
jgi:CRP/FNR family transcriptional regulator